MLPGNLSNRSTPAVRAQRNAFNERAHETTGKWMRIGSGDHGSHSIALAFCEVEARSLVARRAATHQLARLQDLAPGKQIRDLARLERRTVIVENPRTHHIPAESEQ